MYKDYYGAKRQSLGIIQPTIWIEGETYEERYKALFRSSHGLNTIYYSESTNGISWTKPLKTNLPNPNSSINVLYIDGEIYLAYNPTKETRYPLNIVKLLQKDNSPEFEIIDEVLHIVDMHTGKDGNPVFEFSYPYMINVDREIHLVYTHSRNFIEHIVVEI